MMAKPSVLLPEPLGPIRAWTSPRRIFRFTPRRIGLPADAHVQIADVEVFRSWLARDLYCLLCKPA